MGNIVRWKNNLVLVTFQKGKGDGEIPRHYLGCSGYSAAGGEGERRTLFRCFQLCVQYVRVFPRDERSFRDARDRESIV